MVQIMDEPFSVLPEHAKYENAELSDTEIEALMEYFNVSTYWRLRSVLAAMKKRGLGF